MNRPPQCRRCPVLGLCHGGCPEDRVGVSVDDQASQNHLCQGYGAFFTETLPAMRWMAAGEGAGGGDGGAALRRAAQHSAPFSPCDP